MKDTSPSRAIRLFGTDEPVEPPHVLTAGGLSAEYEAGNLRYIRFNGVEMIRAISFLIRDKNWATYTPAISNLEIHQDKDSFSVSYDASVSDPEQELRYAAKIEGHADGRLSFDAEGEAVTDVVTNRAGFVVLHPIAGVAGAPATIEEVNGRIVESKFPELISPGQPIFDIRAITHEFAPGARVTCRMTGERYEMEDQRNWMDASYKTYVRSLFDPWPYMIAKGEHITQSVTLKVEGTPPKVAKGAGAISLRIGKKIGTVPSLGVGLAPEDAALALKNIATLRKLKPAYVICHFDTRSGHNLASLKKMVEVAKNLKAEAWLEAVVTKVEGFEEEIAAFGKMVAKLGSPFTAVMLSPAPDMKSTQPSGPWPPCPPLADVYRLARQHFSGARVVGGMMSYFTEINRKRPPAELTDLVTFTNSALVHSGDDRSVTEGLEATPAMAKSVKAFIGDKPFAVGPSAIGMRFNPYGAAPVSNPKDVRQAMNGNDPRQRGLLGAAWSLGYFAHFAKSGAASIALGGLAGKFGVLHAKAKWTQAWYDKHGGLYPVFHVLRGLARLKSAALHGVTISAPRNVQAIAAKRDGKTELWLANLTGEPVTVTLPSQFSGAKAAVLDAARFETAAGKPEALDRLSALKSQRVELDAYAVMRVVTG
jgi:hypothetical protein